MVRLRDGGYCNLKLFLIYLVVYGHLIEPMIWQSESAMLHYRWIYSVHMPLFAFLSGLFLCSPADCRRQTLRCLPLYLFSQTLLLLITDYSQADTPYWHLWYLLSCGFWSALAWLWFRLGQRSGLPLLLLAVAAGCLAGFDPRIDRVWSLSRSLVFFPYFWAGLLCPRQFPFYRHRFLGLAALLLGTALVFHLQIHPYFLYQAAPYGITGGAVQRLMCYGTGTLLGFGLLCLTPRRRFVFTQMGTDTMPAYLLHPIAVLALRETNLGLWQCALTAAGLLTLLHLLTRWHSSLYGITTKERRDRPWPPFRKSTKHTPNGSTGFFWH